MHRLVDVFTRSKKTHKFKCIFASNQVLLMSAVKEKGKLRSAKTAELRRASSSNQLLNEGKDIGVSKCKHI